MTDLRSWIYEMNIFLKIYIIETVISFCTVLPLGYRCARRDGAAHRQAVVNAILISFISFIPIICLAIMLVAIKEEVEAWIQNDPTLPENVQKLKNNPPPKKEKKKKKVKPIDDRFEIMDL